MPAGDFVGETVANLILRIIADVSQYEEALKQADKALERSAKAGEKATEQYAQSADSAFKRVVKAVHAADIAVNNLTARLNKMGLVLAGVAVASFAPYVAALVKVRNENQRVELMFWKLNETMITFSNVLAEMILPHANKFVEVLQRIATRFENFSPKIKETVMQLTIFRARVLFVMAGINWLFSAMIKIIWVSALWIAKLMIFRFIFTAVMSIIKVARLPILLGLLLSLIGAIAFAVGFLIGKLLILPLILVRLAVYLIPLLILKLVTLIKTILVGLVSAVVTLVSTLAGIVVAAGFLGVLSAAFMIFVVTWIGGWGEIRETTKNVLDWLQKALNSFLSGVHKWAIGFQVQMFKIKMFMMRLKWGGLFGDWKEAWEKASQDAENFRLNLENTTDAIVVDFGEFADNLAEKVDALKEKIKKGIEALFAPRKKPPEWVASFELGLRQMLKAYTDWGEFAKSKAVQIATSMNAAFSDFFFDAFMGELKTFQEYFASFGRFILRIIADIIAQLITALVIKKLLGMWSGVGDVAGAIDVHEGGLIPVAHEGIAPGERMIRAQVGEGVLSRNGMETLGGIGNLNKLNAGDSTAGGGGLNVNLVQIIRAWSPEDVYRERKVLAGAMIEELERNGMFRKAMNRFR